MRNILVIDDEISIRNTLRDIITDEGYQSYEAGDWDEAYRILLSKKVDVVLLDIWLPKVGGMEILDRIVKDFVGIEVIMISGHGNIDIAVKAIKKGAFDFIEKPLSIDKLLTVVSNSLKLKELKEENIKLKKSITPKVDMIGDSECIKEVRQKIKSAADTNARVLITGENGTGKELVARSIHLFSDRKDKPFIDVNCAAIPETLIESELFGYEKGSFTGANALKKGKFEVAHTGTIFLDEIADMSLSTQAKVLRVLQEMEFERIGGNNTIKVDVRVIAATNKNLTREIQNKNFREDLYYRLNVIPIFIPPLRSRQDDIPSLVDFFFEQYANEYNKKKKNISKDALEFLCQQDWPGNIRELKNIIERIIIMVQNDNITIEDIKQYNITSLKKEIKIDGIDSYTTLKEAKESFEKMYITEKLKENNMNVSLTAKILDIERSYLHKKIKLYDIKFDKN